MTAFYLTTKRAWMFLRNATNASRNIHETSPHCPFLTSPHLFYSLITPSAVSPTCLTPMRLEWRSLRITPTLGTGSSCKHGLWVILQVGFFSTDLTSETSVSSVLPVSEIINEDPSAQRSLLSRPDKSVFWCLSQMLWCLCCCSALLITMVVSLLFILLLRYTADVLLWLLIFGVITAIGYGESAPVLPLPTILWTFQPQQTVWFCSFSASVSQVSCIASGSTGAWVGNQAQMSPSLTSASKQTSASTCSSVRRGSFSVRAHFTFSSKLKPLFMHAESFLSVSANVVSFAVISLSVVEAIILIILIFLRTRLRIAIALLKEGSR